MTWRTRICAGNDCNYKVFKKHLTNIRLILENHKRSDVQKCACKITTRVLIICSTHTTFIIKSVVFVLLTSEELNKNVCLVYTKEYINSLPASKAKFNYMSRNNIVYGSLLYTG